MWNVNKDSSEYTVAEKMLQEVERDIPKYVESGHFSSGDFVEMFWERIEAIINNIPQDNEKRKEIETGIAYIQHSLFTGQDLILSQNPGDLRRREIETVLSKRGKFDLFLDFARWKIQHIETDGNENFKDILDFMEYLADYAVTSLENAILYLGTFVRLSQLENGFDITEEHLWGIFDHIDPEIIAKMLEEYDYFWRLDEWDIYDVARYMMEEYTDLTYEEAVENTSETQRFRASLHYFVQNLYKSTIFPRINSLPPEEKKKIFSLLNDFADINDPEHFVPISFHDGNWFETRERERVSEDRVELH